jgi:hypothetical protein
LTMTSDESELVKYMANCFFAVKVTFFNEMKLLCEKLDLDWDVLLHGVLSDGRIAHSHTDVPGHDGQRGYGGTCVLPDAKVLLNESGHLKTIEIERLFGDYSLNDLTRLTIESADAHCQDVEFKGVSKVTRRHLVDEELFVFETDRGEFVCTGDHLMPVWRDERVLIVRASEVKETDWFFAK